MLAHARLDLARSSTCERARRKAVGAFASAIHRLERDPAFVFVQSQPQLYAFVAEDEPALFERVLAFVHAGRFDASVATLWVAADCTIPSGESLIRQLVYGIRYTTEQLGAAPTIAWLPDGPAFSNTLPTILQHAGVGAFMTTRRDRDETRRFPYTQFRWRGPDGASVAAALIAAYDGGMRPGCMRETRARNEPLLVGIGDGGGAADGTLERLSALGGWRTARDWFAELAGRAQTLPEYEGELCLEDRRDAAVPRRGVAARNAELERALEGAEELCAWCVAVRAPGHLIDALRRDLTAAWRIVLRAQAREVIGGTAAGPVYEEVRAEHDRAAAIIARVVEAATSILPQSALPPRDVRLVPPVRDDGGWVFDNGVVRARALPTGALVELASPYGKNVVTQANLLSAYAADRERRGIRDLGWSSKERRVHVDPERAEVVDDALQVRFRIGASLAVMQLSLAADDPFLRVELAVDWRERDTLLRCEQRLALDARQAVFGTPHGTITRSVDPRDPAGGAEGEVPAQRFAAITDAEGDGFALFVPEVYGWSVRGLRAGGVDVGISLLRGRHRSDPAADLGEARFTFALAPLRRAPVSAIERAWRLFVQDERVALFSPVDESVIVVATKPADDGDGVVVRVRECDGESRRARLYCAGRAREAIAVDALERQVADDVRLEDGHLVFTIGPYALRAFRVRF